MLMLVAHATRRCGNPSCTTAISHARFARDFPLPGNDATITRGTSVTVLSKDDQQHIWEAEVGDLIDFIVLKILLGSRTVFERFRVVFLAVFSV